jgi:hypothetical protein
MDRVQTQLWVINAGKECADAFQSGLDTRMECHRKEVFKNLFDIHWGAT